MHGTVAYYLLTNTHVHMLVTMHARTCMQANTRQVLGRRTGLRLGTVPRRRRDGAPRRPVFAHLDVASHLDAFTAEPDWTCSVRLAAGRRPLVFAAPSSLAGSRALLMQHGIVADDAFITRLVSPPSARTASWRHERTTGRRAPADVCMQSCNLKKKIERE